MIKITRNIYGEGGGKGGGDSSKLPAESPNTLRSKAVLRVIEAVSEGEIEGLVNGAKSIYFDGTPLQNEDDSYNFEGITYALREGTSSQDIIPGFPSVEAETAVGVKVTFATEVVRTITDTNIDAVIVTVDFTGLTVANKKTGDLEGSTVNYRIWYQPNGGSYILAKDNIVTGKTTSSYQVSDRIELTGNGPWNIKVTRLTEDAPDSSTQNDIYFSSFTKIIDHKLIYPDTALIGLTIDSSLFGSNVPTRMYDLKGIKVKIPSNYNPLTREYTGIWDGTFVRAWSDNPAWIFYDLATNERYGLGEFVSESYVNKFLLYEIAQYCDELVDNGKGETEPRFTFNYQITSQEEAFKVMQSLASSFRGLVYWGIEGANGSLVVVQDAPRDAMKLVTNANVVEGVFNYQGSAENTRHSVVAVTWNNTDNQGKAEIELVEDPYLINRYGYRQTDVFAYGCTSKSQARRFGKWVLYSEANETEVVTYQASIDHADVRPGDIIKIADTDYANIRMGGRIKSITGGDTTSSVLLDAEYNFEVGQSYSLDLIRANGIIESFPVANSAGLTDTVIINTPNLIDDWHDFDSVDDFDTSIANLDPQPIPYSMFIITSTSISPRLFRVLSNRETDDSSIFEISALFHDPNKYEMVENNIKFEELNFSNFDVGALTPPSNITVREALYRAGVNVSSKAVLSWKPSTDSRVVSYEIEYRKQGQDYRFYGRTQSVSMDILNTQDGLFDFRVRGLGVSDQPSAWVYLENYSLGINGTSAGDVTDFTITPLGDTAILSWAKVNSLNLSHYELRFNSAVSGASWGNSSILLLRIPADATSVSVPNRRGTYSIKAVTIPTEQYTQGVYSSNAALITTEVDGLTGFNFIQDIDEHPSFSGTKTQCSVSSSILRLSTVSSTEVYSSGTYVFANQIDLGAVYTSRITSTIIASGEDITSNFDEYPDIDLVPNIDGASEDSWSVQLQIRVTGDDPASGGAVWSEWQNFLVGDYIGRGFQFRLQLYSYLSNITPAVSELTVSIDMPDRVISETNKTSLTGSDLQINFSPAFKSATPTVLITALNLQQGDYHTIPVYDQDKFTISFYNAAGTRVARNFNYSAIGYGYES